MNEYVNGNLAYKPEPAEEIIGGKVTMMSTPTIQHVFTAVDIFNIFDQYLQDRPCTAFPDNVALFLEEDREEYQPDMMVVCDPNKIKNKGVYGAPDLVVEVLSPSTARNDKGRKRDVYEKHGVREYWIVDPVNLLIDQYVLEDGRFVLRDVYTHFLPDDLDDMKPEERAEVVTEFHCTLFDDLTIRLKDVFRRVNPRL